MPKEMLINVSEGEETRIALVEDGHLEELYMERSSSTSHVGNIYKGKVTNVEPSIQAAFIDFGLGRNGFLHITDLMPTYFGRKGDDIQETVGRKMARRDRPPIQRCLRRGDEITVQIIKEGIGTKGPTLSSYLSIPGRILVMMPGMSKLGVSRKIEDDGERRRLRQILDGLKPPKDVGFIIRTAGVGKTKAEIQRDFTYLSRLWMQIDKKLQSGPGPMELYTEGDLVTRTVRDVFTTDVDQIVCDNEEVAERVKEVIKITAPRTKNKVELYTDPVPLFHKYGIEKDIEMMHSRHVPLPSGGSLVIDSTEAIVAIDVNSGKFRDHADAETTAFKTDMEAAEEIPRQLRLRDLGGVIICDFIDLRYERHRRELEEKLHEKFKNDRAKTKVLRMSQFGIIEMTRQRMRPSLKRSIYFDCPHCKGAGLVKTPESMSLDVMRRLAIAANDARVVRVELAVCPEAAFYLQNRKRSQVAELELRTKKRIVIKADQSLALDEVKLELFDNRDGTVFLAELGMIPGENQAAGRRHGKEQGRPDRSQPRGRGGRQPEPTRRREAEPLEDGFDLDHAEDAVEEREETREDDAVSAAAITAPVPERPESYSNFTDNDVDLGDDDVEEDEVPPQARQARPNDHREAPQRNDQRRDGQRRDEPRRDEPQRDESRRDEPRRDESRRAAPRGDEGRQDVAARGESPRGGQQRGEPRRDHRGGPPPGNRSNPPARPPGAGQQGARPPQGAPPQPGNRPPQPQGNRPPQQGVPQGRPAAQGQPRFENVEPDGPQNGEASEGAEFGTEGEGGGRRRRRRRRGGRGRNRNRNRQDQGPGQPNTEGGVPSASASFDGYDGSEAGEGEFAEDNDRSEPGATGDSRDSVLQHDDRSDRDDRGDRPSSTQEGLFDDRERGSQSDERDEMIPPTELPAEDAQPVGSLVEELNAPAAETPEEAKGAKPVAEEKPKPARGRRGAAAPKRGTKAKVSRTPAAKLPEKEAALEAEADSAQPKAGARRRGSGGGRGKGRAPAKPAAEKGSATPPETAALIQPAPVAEAIVRTGSTDRHHLIVDEVADEPVHRPEPRRPRTYRDLDEIPDDLD